MFRILLLPSLVTASCTYQMYRFTYQSGTNFICIADIQFFDASNTAITLSNPSTPTAMGCVDGNNAANFGVPDGTSETAFASGIRLGTMSNAFDVDSTTQHCSPDRYQDWRCGAAYTSKAYAPDYVQGSSTDFLGYAFTTPTTVGKFSFTRDSGDVSLYSWTMQGCSSNCDVDDGYNANWEDITDSATVGWTRTQEFSISCSAGAVQDPHLTFANGAKADFRGSDNGIYNFVSYPDFSMNVRTQAARFMLKNVTVDGTFMTELFIHARTNRGRTVQYTQSALRANDNNWGWWMSNGTCDRAPLIAIPHSTRLCDDFSAKTDVSSTVFTFKDWTIHVKTNKVYGHISGARRRLDINVDGPRNSVSHGIIGQSFRRDAHTKDGMVDHYPLKGFYRTRAQAEGAIEGVFTQYKMSHPFDTNFHFSSFSRKDEAHEHVLLSAGMEE